MKNITLLGAPVDCGKERQGCLMGPDALRCANLASSLRELGHTVSDLGNLKPVLADTAPELEQAPGKGRARVAQCAGWVRALTKAAFRASTEDQLPIFLGGDHLMSAGTVLGVTRRAQEENREQFVLWLDAHTDFHTLETSKSGNLHGTPVAYFTGRQGFENDFPDRATSVRAENVCMLGIRSVDEGERRTLQDYPIDIHDMSAIDETGIAKPLRAFLERVKAADGHLHLSLDVDFLDPSIAPAVVTTVPGGATFREAHLVMEILHEYDLVTSVDIAELNPFLDERGRTATLIVDLVASLMGRKVLDRATGAF